MWEFILYQDSVMVLIIEKITNDGTDIKYWDTGSSQYVKVSSLPLTSENF